MSFFDHDGASLFFTDSLGDGNAVLLLHGWTCDSHDWSWQIPPLLASGYRVIAMDHRGHGRSSAPTSASYKPQQLADDAAALLKHLSVTSAVVFGHSMGTIVASALSVRHPSLVKGLILVDPVYIVPHAAIAPFLESLKDPLTHELVWQSFEANFYTPETPPWLKTWHYRRILGTPERVVRECLIGLYGGEADSLGNMEVSMEYLKQRKAPRIAVYAAEQTTFVERALPLGNIDEIHVIPNGGHFLHQERPEEFNSLAFGWLDKLKLADNAERPI